MVLRPSRAQSRRSPAFPRRKSTVPRVEALLGLAVAADLDEVDAIFHLLSHFADHLLTRVAQHAFGRNRHAEPGRKVVCESAVADDVTACSEDARSRIHAAGDRVARCHRDEPGRPGSQKASDACAQHFAGIPHRANRRPLRAAVDVDFLGAAALAVADVAMRVDQVPASRFCRWLRSRGRRVLRPRAGALALPTRDDAPSCTRSDAVLPRLVGDAVDELPPTMSSVPFMF